jgi:hypothetical protein
MAGAQSKKETTTVTMPGALIEGFECYIFNFTCMFLPMYKDTLFIGFTVLVGMNTVQRLVWAYSNVR